MKRNFKRVLIIVIVVSLSLAVIGSVYYLFIYDRSKPQFYHPQMKYSFLQTEIERLAAVSENSYGEATITQDEFKGILAYNCTKSSADEIKEYFEYLSRNKYDGDHIVFPDESYEIFVGEARYMPIVKALGYGWYDYSGNIYAKKNGRGEAEGKPNFRNYFNFTIRKGDEQFSFAMYCNTDSAEKALSEAINYMNEYVNKTKS